MPTHMKKFLSRYGAWLVALALGVSVWLFWAVGYPHALAYHEQFQLFLFGGDYFAACISEPGGLARWLAELLVQFYNNPYYGATVLALLFMLLFTISYKLFTINYPLKNSSFFILHSSLSTLALLPPLLLWYVMGDENVLLTYTVALLLALAACYAIRSLAGNCWAQGVVAVVGMPLLYWLIGPMAFLPALYMTVVLPLNAASRRLITAGTGLLALLMVAVAIVISSHQLPYPTDRFWIGLSYYRVPQVMPLLFVVIPAVVLLGGVLSSLLKNSSLNNSSFFILHSSFKYSSLFILLSSLIILAVLLIPRGYDAKKYELIDYDYLVRTAQWKAIISKAEQQQPDLPMSVAATNLALAMEQQLGDRAFQFFQRGTQGLLPPFERNFATTQLTGEIYFRLGLVNTAQRFAFEAMEALPNYAKSVRVMRRLAETNLINRQYAVARKYLQLLEKTLFYRKWARQTLTLLGNEAAIDSHPLYGHLRQMRLQDDILFSDKEIDRICGQLFLHNKQNTVAMQYLLMWPLMNRDIPTFMQYVQVVQNNAVYRPRHIEEAICYAFGMQQQRPPQGLVSEAVASQFLKFANAYNQGGRQNPALLQPFKNTVWYYLVRN